MVHKSGGTGQWCKCQFECPVDQFACQTSAPFITCGAVVKCIQLFLLLILLPFVSYSCRQGESLDNLRSFSAYKAARFAPLPEEEEEEEELDSETETPVAEDR